VGSKKATVQTEHEFSVDELDLICEALRLYVNGGRRMAVCIYESSTNEPISQEAEFHLNKDILAGLSNGEFYLHATPQGEEIQDHEIDIVEGLITMFASGMFVAEQKVELQVEEEVKAELPSLIDDLYEMFRNDPK
jgi:hypothetical protein